MPPRRKPSRDDESGGCSRSSGRRNYCCIALLIAYSTFVSLYLNQGMSRSLSSSQPMIRSSADYYISRSRTNAGLDRTNDDLSALQSPKNGEGGFVSTEDGGTIQPVQQVTTTAEDPNVEDQSVSPKPRLFLHVGPQKTGSSTLQSMLDKLSGLTGKLDGDHLRYRHVMPEAGDFDCVLDDWGGWHDCRASDFLRSLIRTAKEEGANLLLTDENLDANFVSGLRKAIDDSEWDVTVIVVYRRIHEWLVSWYNQIQKTTNVDASGAVLFDAAGIPYRTEHTLWPDKGGIHIPGFGSWYDDHTRNWDPSELAGWHRSIEYFRVYQESFDKVLLYNLHGDGSMPLDFFCDIFGAAHACQRIKSNTIPIEDINGSVHLDHDILAVYAYEQGLVPRTLSRQEVVSAITAYVQAADVSIPRRCDPEREAQIWSWLVATERIAIEQDSSKFWSNAMERALRESYESFVATGKLCDVDTSAIIHDEGWIYFFRSLKGPAKGNLVLHVGPVGEKTMRDALASLAGPLRADNYTVVDIGTTEEALFDCQSKNDKCAATPQLRSVFSSLKNNVLVVNDNLGEQFVPALKEAIDEDRWNVKIVVGYVRRDQLLLTMYDQEYGSLARKEDSSSSTSVPENYSRWPGDEGGSLIPGFYAWIRITALDRNTNGPNLEFQQSLMATRRRRDAYAAVFEDVDVHAVHTAKNLLCKILPGAARACTAAEEAPMISDNEFAAADLLAVRAHDMGLVSGLSRTVVRDAVLGEVQRRSTTEPLARICNAEVTKRLYDQLIGDESTLRGDQFPSKRRISRINEEFQHLLESGKLCALDADKLLRDDGWKQLFRQLVHRGDGTTQVLQ
eukprot:CAMPEP_0197190542 /NCGR_PEP_ID=MMETSP1423-20130617/21839_1 /TAXON_ID=476441 /ORGANISM="Pseudo-nitzschia heimii, Strain UNC1101" /LENGTH=844 /DNA_ID=CAMNT_0042642941 /DNA_START=241 /DNA_END=2778 /DNA_ORIENTATION=+